jgi:hypothetical protein
MRAFFVIAGASFALSAALLAAPAVAKVSYDSPYGYDQTWNAALRLVRVDMGFKVAEKDATNGYMLFEYHSPEGGGKATSGSFEFVHDKNGPGPVKVVVQLPQMPRYHEQVLLDALVRKMRVEYGEPVKRTLPSDAGASPAPDAGTEEP